MKFTTNGSELWVSCKDSYLIVIDANDWHIIKSVAPEEFPITQLQMLAATNQIPSVLRGKAMKNVSIGQINSTDRLAFLTESPIDGSITVESLTPWQCSSIKRFTCAPNGQTLAVLQADGTIRLYSTEYLLRQAFQAKFAPQSTPFDHTCSTITENLKAIDRNVSVKRGETIFTTNTSEICNFLQLKRVLPRQRLLAILHEYGEYPAKYRQIIWRNLFKLPNSTITFCQLRENGPHSCVKSYTRAFDIPDRRLRENFQQILSALINWSQILRHSFSGEDHFLPYFIFPFVKFMTTTGANLLQCFEMVATILLNQCKLWFEFSPLLPANYLGFIENLIDHFSPALSKFYRHHSVNSQIYAWTLMRTAFTDILAEFQWFMLWDHIVSQPAYFMVFLIVAFNCTQYESIVRLKSSTEIRAFFTEPTTINMKLWLRKSYEMMDKCPMALHPKQFIEQFICLGVEQEQYRKILNYPIDEFSKQAALKKKMQKCRESINQRYAELERMERNLMQQIVNSIELNAMRERQRNVKLAHAQALIDVAKQTENQRQQLILTERQLNNREALIKILHKEMDAGNDNGKNEFEWQLTLCDMNRLVGNVFSKFWLYLNQQFFFCSSFRFSTRNCKTKRSCLWPTVHFANVTLNYF